MRMTTHSEQIADAGAGVWEEDFPTPSCAVDFVWPEGAELRGNVNLVDAQMIDRQEIAAEWVRIKTKLLQTLV